VSLSSGSVLAAIPAHELKTMPQLPANAQVAGSITEVEKGFGDLSFVLKLDNAITCELTIPSNFKRPFNPLSASGQLSESCQLEKQGNSIVFFYMFTEKKANPKKIPVMTLTVGGNASVQGLLSRKPNGAVYLKGILL